MRSGMWSRVTSWGHKHCSSENLCLFAELQEATSLKKDAVGSSKTLTFGSGLRWGMTKAPPPPFLVTINPPPTVYRSTEFSWARDSKSPANCQNSHSGRNYSSLSVKWEYKILVGEHIYIYIYIYIIKHLVSTISLLYTIRNTKLISLIAEGIKLIFKASQLILLLTFKILITFIYRFFKILKE